MLLMLWVAVLIALTGIRAGSEAEEVIVKPVASDLHLKMEIEQLRWKISSLESSISDKTKELKTRDDSFSALEKFLEEKSAAIARLQAEVESLKKKGAVAAEEQVGKANARAGELEKEANKLKAEIETLSKQSEALEARAVEAEKKVEELILQIESVSNVTENMRPLAIRVLVQAFQFMLGKTNDDLKRKLWKTERALQVAEEELLRAQLEATSKSNELGKTNDDLKLKLRKIERALKVAEEELLRAQFEATSKSKVLNEIHSAWLPWLATEIYRFQEYAANCWNELGKPALDAFHQKIHSAWLPWLATEIYRFQEYAANCWNELGKPALDSFLQKIRSAWLPWLATEIYRFQAYTANCWNELGKPALDTFLQKIQGAVQEKLEEHEPTEALGIKELVWFLASVALALPMFFIYKIISPMFWFVGFFSIL